jgi:hypothetical protein
VLTAEPLDLTTSTRSSGGYTRNVTKPPPSGPKCSERSGIETSRHPRGGLANKHMLVLLDNFEQVLQAALAA